MLNTAEVRVTRHGQAGAMARTAEERRCLGLKCWREENWHCHSDGRADWGGAGCSSTGAGEPS